MLDCVYVYREKVMSIAQYIINRAQSAEYIRKYDVAPHMSARILDIISSLGYKQYCVQWKNNNALLSVFEDSSCIILYHNGDYMFIMYKQEFGKPFKEIEL